MDLARILRWGGITWAVCATAMTVAIETLPSRVMLFPQAWGMHNLSEEIIAPYRDRWLNFGVRLMAGCLLLAWLIVLTPERFMRRRRTRILFIIAFIVALSVWWYTCRETARIKLPGESWS